MAENLKNIKLNSGNLLRNQLHLEENTQLKILIFLSIAGLIMYELHAPIMMLAQYSLMHNVINRKQFNQKIKEVVQLLKESALILKMEPAGSSEHQMGQAAEEALKTMGVN